MAGNFQKTTSNFFITFLIGLIVVSFMFTGYESMRGSPNAIANVGDQSISEREYRMEYNRQINFYKNAVFGGKDLTSEQIEQFRIKENAMKNLVQSKLQLIFAEQTDTNAAPAQIKKTIKNLDFFLTNGQFDINKYKQLLRANGLSPNDFEEDIRSQVYAENTSHLFSQFPVSDSYIDDIGRFKAMRYNAFVVEINDNKMKSLVKISDSEIKTWLENEANKARTQNLFNQRKPSLGIPEKVKASHILIKTMGGDSSKEKKEIEEIAKKVTPSNFAKMANQYTEDDSGKGKGGSLGTFGRGRMVPQFERVAFNLRPGSISEPVKTNFGYHLIYVEKKIDGKDALYNDHEKKLARELIQGQKSDQLKKLVAKVQDQALSALKARDIKKLKELKNKYNLALDENTPFNRFEGSLGQINIGPQETTKIFAALKQKESHLMTFDLAGKTQIVAIEKSYNKDLPEFDHEKEKNGMQMVLSNKIKQDVLTKIGDNTQVKQFVQL